MSMRYDAPWITGAHLYGDGGLGVIGSLITSTGDNGAGYTYNDLSLPADNAKEICGRITTWPSSGTLTAYEDTSFEFTAADGAYSFQYQLYVDGVATGSPATVSLYIGSVPVTIPGNLGEATASGLSATLSSIFNLDAGLGTATASGFGATITEAGNVTLSCSLGAAVAGGFAATVANNAPTIARPTSDISNTGWTPSTGSDLYAMLDEVSPDDTDYISTSILGAVYKMSLNATKYPGGASQQLNLRASSSTGNGILVTIKDGATTIATRSLTLTPTFDLHTITLTSGEIAAITSGNLTVEMTST